MCVVCVTSQYVHVCTLCSVACCVDVDWPGNMHPALVLILYAISRHYSVHSRAFSSLHSRAILVSFPVFLLLSSLVFILGSMSTSIILVSVLESSLIVSVLVSVGSSLVPV